MSGKSKVLIATPYYAPKVGGLENYAHHIAKALMSLGWDVCVITSNHEGRQLAIDTIDGVRVYRLPTTFRLSNTPVGLSWARHARRIIGQEKPDIINAHTPVPGIADAVARAAGKTPFVLTYHAATLYKQHDILFNAIIFGYRFVEKLMLRKARRIIAVTPYHKDYLSANNKRKRCLIENAIPAQELLPALPAKQPHRLVFIGNLAKAHAWKGLDLVLRAVAIYAKSGKPVQLDVIGGGDYMPHYRQTAQDLGITGNVTFHNQQTGAAKNALLGQATALVCYPTSSNDAFPTVVLEAWAHYTPVIAGNIGALPYIVNDGTDGVLAAAHNPEVLAAAMGAVLENPALQNKLAANGYQRAAQQTWAQQGVKTDQLLRSLLP